MTKPLIRRVHGGMTRRSLLALGTAAAATSLLPARLAHAQGGTLGYWHHFASQTEVAGLHAVVDLFKAQSGIDLRAEGIPTSEYIAKMTTAIMANSRPDTCQVVAERFADLDAMGGLIDVTDRVADWDLKSDFPDNRWTGISKDGRIFGVPSFAFVDWIYYRKDWFEAAGIAPPTTFAELREAAIALTDPAQGRYGFGMRAGSYGFKYVLDVMEAFGAPLMTDGKIGINRDAAIEAVTFWSGLYTTDKCVPPSAPNDAYRQLMEAFTTGQTAMVWHHSGSLAEVSAALEPGVEFGTIALPKGPAAHVARVAYAYNSIMNEAQVDAGWDWISFWGNPEASLAFFEQTGYFPASQAATKDPRIADNPIYDAAVATLEFGVAPPSFPGLSGWSEGSVLPAFQSVLIGQMTPEEAVDTMIADLDKAVR